MPKLSPAAICMLAGLLFVVSGCGKRDDAATGTRYTATTAGQPGTTEAPRIAEAKAPTLADGPDVCFRAIAKQIGADAKVSEVISFFSSGSEIDSGDREPQGQMTTCSVQYQNPKDPRKLLGASLDIKTGTFAPPSPVEISVMGNAATFKLDDYLIPLSKLNPAGLAAIMDGQKAAMSAIYSKYAWSGVRLEAPDGFSNVHTLRLDLDGRLASNDIKAGGYASVSTDGKTIIRNLLKP